MKESSTFTLALLSELSHSLKNIETVFRQATEELTESKDEHFSTIGKDTNIALRKLSNISTTIGLLEEESKEIGDSSILALKNVLSSTSSPDAGSTIIEIKKTDRESLAIELPWNEKSLTRVLSDGQNDFDIPRTNLLLIKLLHSLIKEDGFSVWINNKQIS